MRPVFVLGLISGALIVVSGILTALGISPPLSSHIWQFTPAIAFGLGTWRIFGGALIFLGVFLSKTTKIGYGFVLLLGLFELFVTAVEGDWTILSSGAVLAVVAGAWGLRS